MFFAKFLQTIKTIFSPGQPLSPGPYGLFMWGNGTSGQLDNFSVTNKSTPSQVSGSWITASTGGGTSGGIKSDNSMWMWGSGSQGQMANNTTTAGVSIPIQVPGSWNTLAVNSHVLAIKADGTLWGWGSGVAGQLGNNSLLSKSSPVQISSLTTWKSVSAGGASSFAIKADGTLWAWGYNDYGQLGLGDVSPRSSPTQVGTQTNWSSINVSVWSSSDATVAAVKTDGTLWMWGANSAGQLGLGNTVARSSPVQVGSLTNWAAVATGLQSTIAVKTDGTLWVWGQNGSGYLGLGDTISRSSPTQVGVLTNWSMVNAFAYTYTYHALRGDKTLWGCGYNHDGQVGDGTISSRTTWTQIGTGYNALPVTSAGSAGMSLK